MTKAHEVEQLVVPIVIAVLLVAIVTTLLICKYRDEKKREQEFARLQREFDEKLQRMQESQHSSFLSEERSVPGGPVRPPGN